MKSTLYIVATPIGNLSDMTFRAIETLKDVDIIAAEDTRHTIKLLNHFEIKTPMMSYHHHNRIEAGKKILNLLDQGKNIALVTDAGMPCISDPGFELVNDAHNEHFVVECIPGACAAVTAMALTGFDSSQFIFEGFLPKEKKELKERIDLLSNEERAMIIYEAPHRIKKTLDVLSKVFIDRRICVANEITKLHEKVFIKQGEDITTIFKDSNPRGEYVIVIDKMDLNNKEDWTGLDIQEHVKQYISSGLSKMDAVKAVARDRKIPKSDVYKSSIDI